MLIVYGICFSSSTNETKRNKLCVRFAPTKCVINSFMHIYMRFTIVYSTYKWKNNAKIDV